MRRFPALVLVALVACATADPVSARPDVDKLLAKADREAAQGDLRRAARLYGKADRAADGKSVAALAGLASTSVRIGDYEEAIATARRWYDRDSSPASRAGALYFEAQGLYWKGMVTIWGAPSGPSAGRADGRSQEGRALLASAIGRFRQGLAFHPDGPAQVSSLLFLADALIEHSRYDEAAEALDEYAAAGGDDPYAENLRCWIDQLVDDSIASPEGGHYTPPEKLYSPVPKWTSEAREAGIDGSMLLKLVVTAQGDVRCLRVVQGLPFGMVESATQTVLQWRFRPALINDQPVPVRHDLYIGFSSR